MHTKPHPSFSLSLSPLVSLAPTAPRALLTAPFPCYFPQEEMQAANIDMVYRDYCAHLLIPLNQCRRKSLFLPWKCEHERHAYELCQYKEYKRRMAMAREEQKNAAAE